MSKITVCTPDEARRYIEALGPDPLKPSPGQFKGFVDLTCREEDGSVAWEVHQPNLITDWRRLRGVGQSDWQSPFLFTSPSSEPALRGRSTLTDDGAATSSQSAVVTGSYDSITLTWSYLTTFAVPVGSNRRIGTVGLCNSAWNSNYGISGIWAYTVLSPFKTQTTTQTLELRYRVTLIPTY